MNNKNHQLMCVTSYLKTIAFKKSDNSYETKKKKMPNLNMLLII